MPKDQTGKRSYKERTGIDRLYKYVGVHKVSFYYQFPNGENETLATAPRSDRKAVEEAARIAKRKALDLAMGHIVAGSVAELIDRFKTEEDAKHYADQSKDGKAVRNGTYKNLTKFFGNMRPSQLKTLHGYQYLDDRAKAGAPIKANKELALMSTICKKAIRWGIIEQNPFMNMELNKADKDVRSITRSQIVQFYLWTQERSEKHFKIMGCAALFTYLTGFRAAEVRPFQASGLTDDGVKVTGAKRKKGEDVVMKHRNWSMKLRMVVKRTHQAYGRERLYLFANRHGKPYTRAGWICVWQDAMRLWIGCEPNELVKHPQYFSLQDIRPSAITKKMEKRSADVYDFAAHANPSTTHKHYDRRKVKRAEATE